MTETQASATETVSTEITDVLTAQSVVVARLAEWTRENGYLDTLSLFLGEMGLSGLLAATGADVEINIPSTAAELSRLFRTVTAEDGTVSHVIRVHTNRRQPSINAVRETIYNKLRALSDIAYQEVRDESQFSVVEPEVTPINEAEIIGRFGNSGALVASGEGEAELRRMVGEMLTIAERRSDCTTVEAAMIRAGLGAFMPPREVKRTVTVPVIGDITITVPCNRRGEPQTGDMARLVQQAVTRYWEDQVKTLAFTDVPVFGSDDE